MKSTVGIIAIVALLGSAAAVHAEDLQFKLINNTDIAVTGFYVSHSGTREWEDNLIPEDYILAGGYEVDVIIADGRDTCEYDLSVEFEDGDEVEEYELDLCELGSYTVEYD